MTTLREKLKRDLLIMRALCEEGALLSSEICAVPFSKKTPSAEAIREEDRGATGGDGEAPWLGRGFTAPEV